MNKPDSGYYIRVNGEAVTFVSNRDAIARGIAYVPEDRLSLSLVLEQPIGTNIVISVLNSLQGPARTHPQGAAGRADRQLDPGPRHQGLEP